MKYVHDLFEIKLKHFISLYDFEEHLFKSGIKIMRRGYFLKEEFTNVCLWKSRRPKRLYIKNSRQRIKKITTLALKEKDEKRRMILLCKLKGVSIPTASALLSVTNQKRYPIIDVRCMDSLFRLGRFHKRTITYNSWVEYLKIIRTYAKKYNLPAREIEKGLFAYNKFTLDRKMKNLYR